MIQLFFEQPIKLFFLWLIVQAVVTVCYWSMRSRRSIQVFWVCIVLLPLLEMASILIVTPREKIQRMCTELAVLVEKGDADAVESYIDESFEASGYDRDDFTQRSKSAIERYSLPKITLERIEVIFIKDNQAEAEFDATCVIQSVDMPFEPILSRWRLTWIQKQGQWKIIHIKVLPRPLSPIRSLRQCLE